MKNILIYISYVFMIHIKSFFNRLVLLNSLQNYMFLLYNYVKSYIMMTQIIPSYCICYVTMEPQKSTLYISEPSQFRCLRHIAQRNIYSGL